MTSLYRLAVIRTADGPLAVAEQGGRMAPLHALLGETEARTDLVRFSRIGRRRRHGSTRRSMRAVRLSRAGSTPRARPSPCPSPAPAR